MTSASVTSPTSGASKTSPADDARRAEAGFAWFECTLNALDDSRLDKTIYAKNKEFALTRLRSLRNEVLFLYHVLGHRDEAP